MATPSSIQRSLPTDWKTDRISHIDSAARQINDTIIALLERRAALYRERNALSPAVNLPTEILEIIFEFACWRNDKPSFFNTIVDGTFDFGLTASSQHNIGGPVTPHFIGKVCSTWRNLAQGAPRFWSRIEINLDWRSTNAQVQRFRSYLARSGQCPLDVRLFHDWTGTRDVTTTTVIDVLVAHANRLRTLELIVPAVWDNALARIAQATSQLECLTLQYTPFNVSLDRVDFFARAPKLREVLLLGYSLSCVSLPWTQIERLEASFASIEDCLKMLQRCPRLRTCILCPQLGDFSLSAFNPIIHTSLEVLEVFVESQEALKQFLELLTLPALRSFSSGISSKESSAPSLLPLIMRSTCKLESLRLIGSTMSSEVAECLQALPGLRKLLLYFPRSESGPLLTRRLLDLMNPKKCAGLGRITSMKEERFFTFEEDEEDDEYMLLMHDPEGVYQKGSENVLGPNLEMLVIDGEVLFDGHDFVEFIADRWNSPAASVEDRHPPVSAVQTADAQQSLTITAPGAKLRSVFFKPYYLTMSQEDAAVVRKLQSEGMHVQLQQRRHW